MLAGWLRVIVLIVFFYLIWWIVSSVIEGATGKSKVSKPKGVSLVQDPVCGMFVVRSRAVTIKREGTVKYFCSDQCRRKYLGQQV
jgi:YHS domain-containing protein